MITAYRNFWSKAFDFKGNSSRSDYWSVFLSHIIILFLIELLRIEVLQHIYLVGILIPLLSIQVRRLRDSGKKWQWVFIQLLPFIGIFWLMYLHLYPSEPIAQGKDQT